MIRLVLAAVAAASLATIATSSAYAGRSLQGTRLSGIAVQSLKYGRPAVTAVTLPLGETIELGVAAAAAGI
ncbi:MAG TPA: hypothetical protein VGF34_21020 [Stellaceae bacterium]